MTERPLCRDVSLEAARECWCSATTHLRAALADAIDAAEFVAVAVLQGPTMRGVERPVPVPSEEVAERWQDAARTALGKCGAK